MDAQSIRMHAVPNCFEPASYFTLDVQGGVLKNRFGTKFCLLSGHFLRGLHKSLEHEAGPAWKLILRSCGEKWGARLATRFTREIAEAYGEDLDNMTMARFDVLLREFFALCGWGRFTISYRHLPAGIIEVDVSQPVLAEVLGITEKHCDVLLEGVLKAMFSHITGQKLDCYETQTVATGAPSSIFLLALEQRMTKVTEWIDAGESHAAILEKVLNTKVEG